MQLSTPHARALMRPAALTHLYRQRLRAHLAQELLAGAGIAVAVALVFAVLVASSSIAGSASEAVRTVAGPASLQLRARGDEGFPQALLRRVERIPGVKQAAPLLEAPATIAGPDGRRVTVDLTGTDVSLAVLDGLIHSLPISALLPHGIGLSRSTAEALGIGTHGPTVTLMLNGRASPLPVSAVLGAEEFGALSHALVAVMPLEHMQSLAGLQGRISRILIRTSPGQTGAVRASLERLANGRITVASADQDISLLVQALRPSDQASDLFAAISAVLGFLFAFCAFLVTVPERREAIADLRIDGARRSAIAQMVLFQALVLGLAASIVGVLVGYVLSSSVFQSTPGYLSQAFVLGRSTEIGVFPLAAALIGGLLASCLASAVPLLDLRRDRAVDAVYVEEGAAGQALAPVARRWLAAGALTLLLAASLLYALVSSAAILACLLITLASVLMVPLALSGALGLAGALGERFPRLTSLPVAISALRSTTLRSLALAATGTVALFGSVALGGARSDLLKGIGQYTANYVSGAKVWVLTPDDNQATDAFPFTDRIDAIDRIPGVAGVDSFQGSFLNVGDRRLWVIGWPPQLKTTLLGGQIIEGNERTAAARIRRGGWAAVSQQLAAERHLHLGGTLTLPTPTGRLALRVAAMTTNFGWSPGAVVMSTSDYRRAWSSRSPSALGIQLTPGTDPSRARAAISAALGPSNGLEVLTAKARAEKIVASASEGLGQLSDISTLLVLAAVLALFAALLASIWQRRASLADLRVDGARPSRLRRILTLEATMLLGSGTIVGALAGVYGQAVIDSYLRHVTGFPVASFAAGLRPLEVLAAVLAIVMTVSAIPAWLASRVPPTLALDDGR
jgi:putative ABC transport system permease protein